MRTFLTLIVNKDCQESRILVAVIYYKMLAPRIYVFVVCYKAKTKPFILFYGLTV